MSTVASNYMLPRGMHHFSENDSERIILLIDKIREVIGSLSYQEVILSPVYFSDTVNTIHTSIDKRYDFKDKKDRDLTLSVDSSLAILHALSKTDIGKGLRSTLHRVFRYRNDTYRSWLQFTAGIFGVSDVNIADEYILLTLEKIINNVFSLECSICLGNPIFLYHILKRHFADYNEYSNFLLGLRYFGVHKDFVDKKKSKFSDEEKALLSTLKDPVTIEKASDIVSSYRESIGIKEIRSFETVQSFYGNLCTKSRARYSFDFLKVKSTSFYDGLTFQVFDLATNLLIVEGGRYDEFSNTFSKGKISSAISLCIGIELLAQQTSVCVRTSLCKKVLAYSSTSSSLLMIPKVKRAITRFLKNECQIVFCETTNHRELLEKAREADCEYLVSLPRESSVESVLIYDLQGYRGGKSVKINLGNEID